MSAKNGISHEWMVNDPETGPIIRQLEAIRRTKKVVYDDGFTSALQHHPLPPATHPSLVITEESPLIVSLYLYW